MEPYKGRFKLRLDELSIPDKIHNNVVRLKFSISFNNIDLYIGKAMLEQLLYGSDAIRNYILKASKEKIELNREAIEKRIDNIYMQEIDVTSKVNIRGTYFFIDVFCGRNHNVNDIIMAIKRLTARTKTTAEILRG